MVNGTEDDVSEAGEVFAAVAILFDAVAIREPAAVDPEQHRPLFAVVDAGREDVDAQAILAYVVVVPVVAERGVLVLIPVLHVLRRSVAPPERRVDIAPRFGFLLPAGLTWNRIFPWFSNTITGSHSQRAGRKRCIRAQTI